MVSEAVGLLGCVGIVLLCYNIPLMTIYSSRIQELLYRLATLQARAQSHPLTGCAICFGSAILPLNSSPLPTIAPAVYLPSFGTSAATICQLK